MKGRLLFSILFFLTTAITSYSQFKIKGSVEDSYGTKLNGVVISVRGHDVTALTLDDGLFELSFDLSGRQIIDFHRTGFESVSKNIFLRDAIEFNLGVVVLSTLSETDLGIISFDEGDFDNEDDGVQTSVGLMKSSRDIFSRITSYDLGYYWFRPRGLDAQHSRYVFNGVSMAKSVDGRIDFGNWGGLNEITRYPEVSENHSPSEYFFGGLNGIFYKEMRAGDYRKGNTLTFSSTNRSYRNRITYRHSSGMNKQGWAYTIMGARRWASEGINEGTHYDAYGAYVGVEKLINEKHSLALNFIGSPYKRASNSPNTQEVYDLAGKHYNSYWGWQDGIKRNERVKRNFNPLVQLTHYWRLGEKNKINTTISAQIGFNEQSRLDRYNAANPSPTSFRNLPSFAISRGDNEGLGLLNNIWKNNNQEYTQIDWAKFYRINLRQPVKDYNGVIGKQAVYFVGKDVSYDTNFDFVTSFISQLTDKTKFSFNYGLKYFTSKQSQQVKDLLGADFVVNRDPYGIRRGESGIYNLNQPDNVVARKGDKIRYDYTLYSSKAYINPTVNTRFSRLSLMLSGIVSYSANLREGHYKHYLYENSSSGTSQIKSFLDFGIKANLSYKLGGRSFLVYNGACFTEAPFLNGIFVNPRVNNHSLDNLKSMRTTANDISYVMNSPRLRLKATAYLIRFDNAIKINRYFADGLSVLTTDELGQETHVTSAFVTEIVNDAKKEHLGIELGAEYNITTSFSVSGAASVGQYVYKNNPDLYITADNITKVTGIGKSYLRNYRIGGTPQQAYIVGARYNSPKYWWVGISANYMAENYIDPSPQIRTDQFLKSAPSNLSETQLRDALRQHRFDNQFMVNINLGKSFKVGKDRILMVTMSVNNLLNNKDYITSGFEQTRFVDYQKYIEDKSLEKPVFTSPKIWYMQGVSYFVNAQLRF